MKKIFAACGILAVLMAFSVVSLAQAKGANFAGTWTLDKSKSELPPQMADRIQSMTWTVTQSDAEVSREQKMEGAGGGPGGGGRPPGAPGGGPPPGAPGGGPPLGGGGGRGMGMMGGGGPLKAKLDGSETTTENERGKSSTKAKWLDGGKILELSTVRNMSTPNGDMTITTTEHWELADGGKTLKVHQSSETPMGTRESKMVFTKQ